MWCIRSISPDELHADDVRGRFIRYCQNPARVDDATRAVEDRFDSDFERDVYRQLTVRGYRVKVPHRVGRFRIDLVIEGRRGRLAVELDGDAYHGPDRWEADRNRQAVLERLGWTFHRIRGSAYYRGPDAALASLWDRLDALGILPDGAPDPSPPPVITVHNVAEPVVPAPVIEDQRAEKSYVPHRAPEHQVRPPEAPGLVGPATGEPLELTDEANRSDAEPLDREADSPPQQSAYQANPADRRLPVLAPHRAWQPHHVPDIHSASPWEMVMGIIDIVTGEGPVVTDRVYELYVRASGGHRVTKAVRDALDQATRTALDKGLLEQIRDNMTSCTVRTLYLPGTPPVIERRRGDRELEHIPPTEVATVARHILDNDPYTYDSELKRLLLTAFERIRLTTNASAFLDDCIAIARR
jgi:very-short-patch-repair endonuclease